jgi:ribonuclease HI
MRSIEIYTDGGCRPANPGHGAFSFVVSEKNKVIHEESHYGGETTNNIMELTAAIKALEWCKDNGYKDDLIYIYTDSQYLQQGINSWVDKWEKRGWKTGNRKPVANQEIWKRLAELKKEMKINFQWIRGHSGVPNNVRADELCNNILDIKLLSVKEIEVEENKNDIIDDKDQS